MDPLSITATSITLAIQVARSIIYIKNAVATLREASDTVADLEEEILLVQTALEQIERMLRAAPDLVQRLNLGPTFALAVGGSEAILACLGDHL